MKQIALLHTVKSVVDFFGPELNKVLEGKARLYNIWDEFLAVNPNDVGEFTTNNKNRLLMDLKNAELTGADLIVVTCSTLTPHLPYLRPLISVPVIAIDDAMSKKAVSLGKKILVMATAGSTVQGTCDKLLADAEEAGVEVEIESMVFPDAFEAMKKQEMDLHDELLLKAAKNISGYDCIVLAQASMAHLDHEIELMTEIPTVSSPRLCMEQVRDTLF